jgi:hypothetical protein
MKVHDYFSDEESDLIELSEEELTDLIKKTKLVAWEENKEVFIKLMIYCPFFIDNDAFNWLKSSLDTI